MVARMSAYALPADDRKRLAAFVFARRHELIAVIVESSTSSDSVASIDTFAKAFLGRLCHELRDGDPGVVDRMTTMPAVAGDSPAFGRIAVDACRIVSDAFESEAERPGEVVAYLTARASELDKRFRSARIKDRAAARREAPGRAADDIVASLLSALEARDSATCDHSRAVGMWSGRVAKSIGLNAQQQAFAVLAGTLHDVGKIATPTELLLKPAPLLDEEWEIMRAHSQIGAKMLERIPSLREFAPIVRAHHERFDGEGYPDRLAGAAIPLIARVVAVADAFHAMISKRPYRPPIPVENALGELRRNAGTQWDGRVVDAMFSIVEPAVGKEAEGVARAAL
jgi:putative nucleotidyltransferase with HDIG domain